MINKIDSAKSFISNLKVHQCEDCNESNQYDIDISYEHHRSTLIKEPLYDDSVWIGPIYWERGHKALTSVVRISAREIGIEEGPTPKIVTYTAAIFINITVEKRIDKLLSPLFHSLYLYR